MHVLVVDPDRVVRATMSTLLLMEGWQVSHASSGAQALEKLTQHSGSVDGVIVEAELPDMSGEQLAHHVEALGEGIRVMLVSRRADIRTEWPSCRKPYDPGDFLESVRRLMGPD